MGISFVCRNLNFHKSHLMHLCRGGKCSSHIATSLWKRFISLYTISGSHLTRTPLWPASTNTARNRRTSFGTLVVAQPRWSCSPALLESSFSSVCVWASQYHRWRGMQSTGVIMEKKKKKENTQDWNRRSHTHDRATRDEISTGDNHQPKNKTKEFRNYKKVRLYASLLCTFTNKVWH